MDKMLKQANLSPTLILQVLVPFVSEGFLLKRYKMNKTAELNRLVNRQIAKTLDALTAENVIMTPLVIREIKYHYRQLEKNITTNILNTDNTANYGDNQNDKFNR